MADTVFTNVQVLDGSGDAAVAGEVRVQGNRIKDVAAKVDHEGAEVIDGGGATLMPGLVEAHAHPSFTNTTTLEGMGALPPEEHTLLTMRHAKLLLDQGFTSLCCAASAKPRLDIVIRNAIEAGEIPGPRMLAATPEMTVSGGLGDIRLSHMQDRQCFEIICDGPDDFRRVSRQMCREGVDTLKINPSGDEFVPCAKANQTVMNDAEVAAVVEVARSRDKRVAAHARSAESVKMCVRHGVEIVYHATLCDDEARDLLESVKDTVFVAPTLGITIATLFEASDWGITEEVATDLGLRRELEIAVENMKDLKKRGRPGPSGGRLRLRMEPGRQQRARPRALRQLPWVLSHGGDHRGDEARRRDHDEGERAGAGEEGLSRRPPPRGRGSGARRQYPSGPEPAARDHEGRGVPQAPTRDDGRAASGGLERAHAAGRGGFGRADLLRPRCPAAARSAPALRPGLRFRFPAGPRSMPPPRSGRRTASAIHRLYVCTTCVRDLRLAPGEPSRGQQLAEELERSLNGGEGSEGDGGIGTDPRLHFIKVPCLNGCLSPCNVALRASGKFNLRFSLMKPDDARAVLAFARIYLDHSTGDVPEEEWPEALRGKRTVRTPPPHLLLGGGASPD